MEQLDINKLLDREEIANDFIQKLREFIVNRNDITIKRGFYFYGEPGTGKTYFVTKLLKDAGFDIVKYDAGDIRNQSVITNITKYNIPDMNIMSLMNSKKKRIVIIMDEIDGMNSGDKGGINSLIKLIRPKKTKKQKEELINYNPIICIGSYHIDKKIKDLMKVCYVYELKSPSIQNIISISKNLLPNMSEDNYVKIAEHVQGDLRQLKIIIDTYIKNNNNDNSIIKNFDNLFCKKSLNEDTKQIVKKLINTNYDVKDHSLIMNETDRTIVGLLWHENIIDVLQKQDIKKSINFYSNTLNDICIADYIDRITFQKQIWQFNEMSSLIKTFKNNYNYHNTFDKKVKYNPSEVRFTKVLTKYSTEYNNFLFVQNLCQKLNMDKKDLFNLFSNFKNNNYNENDILNILVNYDIGKLELERMYRMLNI